MNEMLLGLLERICGSKTINIPLVLTIDFYFGNNTLFNISLQFLSFLSSFFPMSFNLKTNLKRYQINGIPNIFFVSTKGKNCVMIKFHNFIFFSYLHDRCLTIIVDILEWLIKFTTKF